MVDIEDCPDAKVSHVYADGYDRAVAARRSPRAEFTHIYGKSSHNGLNFDEEEMEWLRQIATTIPNELKDSVRTQIAKGDDAYRIKAVFGDRLKTFGLWLDPLLERAANAAAALALLHDLFGRR